MSLTEVDALTDLYEDAQPEMIEVECEVCPRTWWEPAATIAGQREKFCYLHRGPHSKKGDS